MGRARASSAVAPCTCRAHAPGSDLAGAYRAGLGALVGVLVLSACGGGTSPGAPSTDFLTPSPSQTPPAPSSTPDPTPEPTPQASFTIADGLGGTTSVTAASDGRGYLVAFDAVRDRGRGDVFAVRLDADGVRLDDDWTTLSDRRSVRAAPDADYGSPVATFDGTAYDVVWFGSQGLSPEIPVTDSVFVATRLDSAGVVRAPAKEIAIRSGSGVGAALAPPPAVAARGSDFVALWSVRIAGGVLGADIGGARVAYVAGGFSVEDLGIVAPPMALPEQRRLTAGPPAIATSGGDAVGAWVESELPRDGASKSVGAVWASVFDGSAWTRTRVADVAGGDRLRTAIATDGTDFLLIWEGATDAAPEDVTEIRGARFRPGVGVLDRDDGFAIQAGVAPIRLAGVAYGPGGYLVAWIEPRDSVDRGRLQAVLVSPGGEVDRSATLTIADDVGPPSAVGAASDGRRFLLVFLRREPTPTLAGMLLDLP